jgi:CBS domain-containing protein
MDIFEIAQEEFLTVAHDDRIGSARTTFEAENPKGIIVTKNGDYAGVITERQLLQSHVDDDTRVSKLTKTAPRVDRHENVRDVARMLVEGGTTVAPVFEGENLWGVVTVDAILEAVLENLDALTVEQIYTQDVVAIGEESTIGEAINRMREHGISRLPVLNENGYLAGVVTTHDIMDVALRDMDKSTRGERSGDVDRMLDLPVYDVMNSPVETIAPDASVRDAVARMLDNDYAGLFVTREDDRMVAGVVTKTDVLRALSYTEESHMDVQITNIELLDDITREEIQESITGVADKYSDMQVRHAHVRFHEHKERHRGVPLIQAQIRLRTNRGQMAGSGEGYGADAAFHVALDTLERNVLEKKGIQADAEYEGQLLRKLGEL